MVITKYDDVWLLKDTQAVGLIEEAGSPSELI